ncbi:MAG: response regulator, partial [Rhodospirillales bacterium]|nr:response regulator [Rhodospirillales bacterium]
MNQRLACITCISEEMRKPIASLMAATGELLAAGLPAEQKIQARQARGSAEELQHLLDNLHDMWLVETGRLALEVLDLDLDEVAESAVEAVAARAEAKGLSLEWSIAADVERKLRGDPGRLRQVMANLLDNAVRFTASGRVVLSIETANSLTGDEHQGLAVSIADTGLGMDHQVLWNINQGLSRSVALTCRIPGAGAGFGLAIARALVALMSGTMSADSRPGSGSTFRFTARLRRRPTDHPGFSDGRLYGQRVLVVESGLAQRRLARWLDGWGCTVATVASAMAALAVLADAAKAGTPFQFAVIDTALPDMAGPLLARLVAQVPAFAVTRLVLIADPGAAADPETAGLVLLGRPLAQARLWHCLTGLLEEPQTLPPAGLRLLVAEDNSSLQQELVTILGQAGHSASLAGDGLEAVDAARAQTFDAILLDMRMPEMDGVAAAEAIRLTPGVNARTPLLAMAAADDTESLSRARAA